jgi:hypothetical protein
LRISADLSALVSNELVDTQEQCELLIGADGEYPQMTPNLWD